MMFDIWATPFFSLLESPESSTQTMGNRQMILEGIQKKPNPNNRIVTDDPKQMKLADASTWRDQQA